jgi:hypothetical protein
MNLENDYCSQSRARLSTFRGNHPNGENMDVRHFCTLAGREKPAIGTGFRRWSTMDEELSLLVQT